MEEEADEIGEGSDRTIHWDVGCFHLLHFLVSELTGQDVAVRVPTGGGGGVWMHPTGSEVRNAAPPQARPDT